MIFYGIALLLGGTLLTIPRVLAQDTMDIVDPATGFKFPGAQVIKPDPPLVNADLSFGVAFPKGLDKDEYIGYLTARRPKGKSWAGISHTSSMARSLLLVTWAEGQNVLTSFRYAKDYEPPVMYKGKGASLTQLSHSVNATHYSLTYRCQKCLSWEHDGVKGNQSFSKNDEFVMGWAQSSAAPSQPKLATSAIDFHDLGFGVLIFDPKVAANANYDTMAAMVPKGPAKRRARKAV